jgi:hypothetical protein
VFFFFFFVFLGGGGGGDFGSKRTCRSPKSSTAYGEGPEMLPLAGRAGGPDSGRWVNSTLRILKIWLVHVATIADASNATAFA